MTTTKSPVEDLQEMLQALAAIKREGAARGVVEVVELAERCTALAEAMVKRQKN